MTASARRLRAIWKEKNARWAALRKYSPEYLSGITSWTVTTTRLPPMALKARPPAPLGRWKTSISLRRRASGRRSCSQATSGAPVTGSETMRPPVQSSRTAGRRDASKTRKNSCAVADASSGGIRLRKYVATPDGPSASVRMSMATRSERAAGATLSGRSAAPARRMSSRRLPRRGRPTGASRSRGRTAAS